MPILKREPDQFPSDLLQCEHEALTLAQAALARGVPAGLLERSATRDQNSHEPLVVESSLRADVVQEPVAGGLRVDGPSDSLAEPVKGGPAVEPMEWSPGQLGTFSYFSEYLGVEAPPQPLTFWSGDWDEFQKFDPEAQGWWCLYTHSRQEKLLMRHLFNRQLSFYCPLIEKRYRSPGGRMRSSFLPLFNNYVFLKGTDDDRRLALSTNCVLASKPVQQPDYFVHDLWQIGMVLQSGVAVTAEQKLEKGDPVMVKSGPFKGFEGFVQRRAGKTRFLIFLRYLEQGVSMEIDEGALVAM